MLTNKYYDLVKKDIYPLATSLTGKGARTFLKIIKKNFPKLKYIKLHQEQKFLTGGYQMNGTLKMLI